MSIALDTPFKTEKSIRSINFFNNRLLSAQDLNAEKDANRAEHKQLGRALGDGIVRGLQVQVADGSVPSLTISPGLAINRYGRAFELFDEAVVTLSKPASDQVSVPAVLEFAECEPPQAGVYILNEGVYLLTIKPVETGEGRALVSGLNGTSAGCNVKFRVSAVRFRLISLDDLLNQELSDLQAALNAASVSTLLVERIRQRNKLRNRVAHCCYGTGDARLDSFISDPFGASATDYGLLANLRQLSSSNVSKLTDCEVPLATVYWTNDGLQWVDMWSVRRCITPALDAGFAWPLFAARRAHETEAMMMQFQAQIETVLDSGFPLSQIIAKEWFAYLPPAGLLPISTGKRPRGFDYSAFFSQMTYRHPIFVEGAQVRPLWQEARNYPAIDTGSGPVVWLYLVRENAQAALSGASPPQTYMAFASGHTPYRGEARYDVHHWDYGNFS